MRKTRQILTTDAAVAIAGAGNSTRNIVEVVRRVLERGTLVLCPPDPSDPAHVLALMRALQEFALLESHINETLTPCCDCPSIGCNPTHEQGGEL